MRSTTTGFSATGRAGGAAAGCGAGGSTSGVGSAAIGTTIGVGATASGGAAGQGAAAFDVTICDPSGAVLVEVSRFVIRRIEAGRDFGGEGPAAPGLVAFDVADNNQQSTLQYMLRGLQRVYSGRDIGKIRVLNL